MINARQANEIMSEAGLDAANILRFIEKRIVDYAVAKMNACQFRHEEKFLARLWSDKVVYGQVKSKVVELGYKWEMIGDMLTIEW